MYEKTTYLTEAMLQSMRNPWDSIREKIIHEAMCDKLAHIPNTISVKVVDAKGNKYNPFRTIKKVIFNNPATIIIWGDNTKTIVKCEEGETYDKEKGFLLCWLKGINGSKKMQKELAKWVYKTEEK